MRKELKINNEKINFKSNIIFFCNINFFYYNTFNYRIKTNKFNKLISEKVYQQKNINLELDKIKFKLDIKEFSLFLETQNPKITYRNLSLPVQNIKIYVDFLSVLKSKPIIKKTNLIMDELDIMQLNQLSAIIKPSNFKSLLNNKIKAGKLVSEIEIYLDEQGLLKFYC